MTARDTIAQAIVRGRAARVDWSDEELADAVIAAVRAMPVEDQAQLISGGVNRDHDLSTNRRITRVVGVWRDAR